MKNISKLMILLLILLQIAGHPVKSEYFLDVLHSEAFNSEIYRGRHEYKFGWPVPFILVAHVESCTTSIYLETDYIAMGFVYDVIWLAIALNILEKYWPITRAHLEVK